jgi:hypothetical protein
VAFSSKVAHLLTLEVQKVAGGKLLWQPSGSLLWRWGRSTVELLLLLLLWLLLMKLLQLELWVIAPILLLLWSTQLNSRWGIHQAVLGRDTARTATASGSRHRFFSSSSHQPWQWPSSFTHDQCPHSPNHCMTGWQTVSDAPAGGW